VSENKIKFKKDPGFDPQPGKTLKPFKKVQPHGKKLIPKTFFLRPTLYLTLP
jgi:hypothetical protein